MLLFSSYSKVHIKAIFEDLNKQLYRTCPDAFIYNQCYEVRYYRHFVTFRDKQPVVSDQIDHSLDESSSVSTGIKYAREWTSKCMSAVVMSNRFTSTTRGSNSAS